MRCIWKLLGGGKKSSSSAISAFPFALPSLNLDLMLGTTLEPWTDLENETHCQEEQSVLLEDSYDAGDI